MHSVFMTCGYSCVFPVCMSRFFLFRAARRLLGVFNDAVYALFHTPPPPAVPTGFFSFLPLTKLCYTHHPQHQ